MCIFDKSDELFDRCIFYYDPSEEGKCIDTLPNGGCNLSFKPEEDLEQVVSFSET